MLNYASTNVHTDLVLIYTKTISTHREGQMTQEHTNQLHHPFIGGSFYVSFMKIMYNLFHFQSLAPKNRI